METSWQKQVLQCHWSDVQAMLESVDSQDELQQALKDPENFLKNLLAGAGGEVARKLFLSKLKPLVEPMLSQQGLLWSDVQPMFASVDSQEELQQALSDPETFLKNLLAGAGGSVPFVCVGSFL